jgi:hypothetical protein
VSDFAKFKNDINATKVTAELLGKVMDMYAAMPPDERLVFEARAMRVLRLLEKAGVDADRGLLAMTITIRLMALDAMLEDSQVQGWILPGPEPGVTYVHADLLKAAAEEPIVESPEGHQCLSPHHFGSACCKLLWLEGARSLPAVSNSVECRRRCADTQKSRFSSPENRATD